MTRKHVKNKRSRKAGRGVLFLITGFFLASGLLRLGSGTGSAIAREVQAISHSGSQQEEVEPVAPAACETDEGIGELLAALKKREARVAAQEAALVDRMQVLAAAEEGAKRNLAALAEAEQQLKATMALADSAAEDDLSRLTTVYENMKAKDAAKLFEEMDPQFSAGFLGRMRPDAAAAIFAGLTPAKAYSISVILAGRNAEVPTEK
ncbi:MotE family protein [Profundibacter sp.]